jgi:hypothetical protein
MGNADSIIFHGGQLIRNGVRHWNHNVYTDTQVAIRFIGRNGAENYPIGVAPQLTRARQTSHAAAKQ